MFLPLQDKCAYSLKAHESIRKLLLRLHGHGVVVAHAGGDPGARAVVRVL